MASRDRKDVFVNSDDFAAYVANVLDESGDEESDSEQDDMIHENNEMSDGTNDDSSDNESDDNPPARPCDFAWIVGRNNVSTMRFTSNHGINPIISRQLEENCTESHVFNHFCDETFRVQNHHCYFKESFGGILLKRYLQPPKPGPQENVKFVPHRGKEVKQCTNVKIVMFHFICKHVLRCFTPKPTSKQRSKSSGLVDNVTTESRRLFSWCAAFLYFRAEVSVECRGPLVFYKIMTSCLDLKYAWRSAVVAEGGNPLHSLILDIAVFWARVDSCSLVCRQVKRKLLDSFKPANISNMNTHYMICIGNFMENMIVQTRPKNNGRLRSNSLKCEAMAVTALATSRRHLSVVDQLEMDKLNDDIRRLTQENKSAFATRMKLEAEKNKLENLLTNNLIRRKDELIQALQEISVEERKRTLDNSRLELAGIEKRIEQVNKDFKAMEKKVQEAVKRVSNKCKSKFKRAVV
ncbi:Structural maintenance of chromosomes protein 3 [Homalodisca vitripennis]|nr:Structural maintenance of chromosomes protein 3 [Homalodisca vitripennis]